MEEKNDFMLKQQQAIERMREMSKTVKKDVPHTMPPAPAFVSLNGNGEKNSVHKNAEYAENAGYAHNHAETQSKDKKSDFYDKNTDIRENNGTTSFLGIDLPILDRIKSEPDMTLVLGILLILWSEKADKKLLLALLYILF